MWKYVKLIFFYHFYTSIATFWHRSNAQGISGKNPKHLFLKKKVFFLIEFIANFNSLDYYFGKTPLSIKSKFLLDFYNFFFEKQILIKEQIKKLKFSPSLFQNVYKLSKKHKKLV